MPVTAQQIQRLMSAGASDDDIKFFISQHYTPPTETGTAPLGEGMTGDVLSAGRKSAAAGPVTDENGQSITSPSRSPFLKSRTDNPLLQGAAHPTSIWDLASLDAVPHVGTIGGKFLSKVPDALETVGGAMDRAGKATRRLSPYGLMETGVTHALGHDDWIGPTVAAAPYAMQGAGKASGALGRLLNRFEAPVIDLGGAVSRDTTPFAAATPHFEPPSVRPPLSPRGTPLSPLAPVEHGPHPLDVPSAAPAAGTASTLDETLADMLRQRKPLTPQAAFTPSKSHAAPSTLPGAEGLSVNDEAALREAMNFKPGLNVTSVKPTAEGDAAVLAARAARRSGYKSNAELDALYKALSEGLK